MNGVFSSPCFTGKAKFNFPHLICFRLIAIVNNAMIEINAKRTVMELKGISRKRPAGVLAEQQSFFDDFQCVSYIDLFSDAEFACRAAVASTHKT